MDIDALDSIWLQLSEYEFDDDEKEQLKQIHKAIVEFDVDYLQDVELVM